MSSLLSADKDQTRTRKSLFDSSSTSPHAISRSQRAATDGVLRRAASLSQTGRTGNGPKTPPEQERLLRLDPGSLAKARAGTLPLTPDPSVSPRRTRLSPRRQTEEEAGCKDFKKLYEAALAANGRLRSRLDTSREELALVQSQLGRVTGQQKRRRANSDYTTNMLETEKKGNKSLQKKISDMEEELKAKTELSSENQRLKDENGALIRVISKLSK